MTMHSKTDMAELCKQHLNKYVLVHTTDGQQFDGIVESVDDEYVYLAVPVGNAELVPPQTRIFTAYGYPYGGYGYGFGYPGYFPGSYPYYGGRFRRLALPLAVLAAISLLPYF